MSTLTPLFLFYFYLPSVFPKSLILPKPFFVVFLFLSPSYPFLFFPRITSLSVSFSLSATFSRCLPICNFHGEMARKLRFFKEQMEKAGVSSSIKSEAQTDINVDDLEVKLGELEAELVEINANNEKLQRTYNEFVEYKLVFQKVGGFFSSALSNATAQQRETGPSESGEESLETPLLQGKEVSTDPSKQIQLGFIIGLVPKEKSLPFERIIFRATRGNVYIRQVPVEEPVTDPVSGEKVEKNVFVVFYSEERAKAKILKICEAFGASRYSFIEDFGKQL